MNSDKIKSEIAKKGIKLAYVLTEKFVTSIRREFGNKDPEVILDIGSRDLEQSIELRYAFPNSKIIAFEPNPDQYDLCLKRSKMFDIDFIPCAISDEEGVVDFWIVDYNEGGSSLLKPIHVPWSTDIVNKTVVKSRRIDNIMKELKIDKVDCVWLDVQGVELKALDGFGTYLKDVKVIQTEASPNPYYEGHIGMNDLQDFLTTNNFELDFSPARCHPYKEGDLICIKRGKNHNLTSIANKVYTNTTKLNRIRPINILVIGELNNMEYLKRYFENATIFNIKDLDFKNEPSIDESLEKFNVYFDIILDMSSNDYWDQIRLIRNSVRHLSTGGILVIENIIKSSFERYAYDIWEYRHNDYFFEENFEDNSLVLIRNNLKYGKNWIESQNSFN
jgi:FkbM family methyltransferase